MELDKALQFAREHKQSVLVTLRKDGKPQLSNVLHWTADDGVIRISITADRAKYHNLKRSPWAALHVTQADFWGYAVLEGPAELSDVSGAPDDATVAELVELYRAVSGEHPDWDEYRQAQIDEKRVVVRLRPDHVYGMLG